MSTQVQQLRGTTAENNAFTGKAGVITVDTEKNDLRIHDGTTRGGVSILEKVTDLQRNGGTITGNLDVSQNLKGRVSLKTNGWIFIENDGTADINNYGIRLTVPEKKADHTAEITLGAEGELRFRMASSPSDYALQCYQNGYVRVLSGLIVGDKTNVRTDGNILGSNWINGDLASHIESRCTAFQNACVTDSRVAGWVDVLTPPSPGVGYMPAGYFVAATYYESHVGGLHICGRQPQLYIANRGWYSLGWW